MAKTLVMPKLGVTMDEGRIIEWKIEQGSFVKKGDLLVVIESDKLALEYESPNEGYLTKILAQPGDVIPVGEPICLVGEEKEAEGGKPAQQSAAPAGQDIAAVEQQPALPQTVAVQEAVGVLGTTRVKAVPLVRKLARDRGIDLASISGTGPGGRVTKNDILNHTTADKLVADGKIAVKQGTVPVAGEQVVLQRITLNGGGMRGTIAKRMTQSIVECPQGSQFLDIDATETLAIQEFMRPAIKEKTGLNLSMTAILVKTVAKALQAHPLLNSIVENNEIKVMKNINIGIAASVKDGLMVPVIRDADQKSLAQIVIELSDLTTRAREGKLNHADLADRTFSVTNLGMYGAGHFTPLLNPPESCILGVGAISKKAIVKEDRLEACPILPLSLTMDHRSIDGVPGAQFFGYLKKLLETPWQFRIIDIDF